MPEPQDAPKGDEGVLALGSVVLEGPLHNKLSLGCQDACHMIDAATMKIAVVCDGCSSAEWDLSQNQVGAILGAQYLATALARNLLDMGGDRKNGLLPVLTKSENEMLEFFRSLRDKMKLDEASERDFVLSKLIFSILGFATVDNRFWIFGLGDGCYGVDGHVVILDRSPVPFLCHRVLKGRSRGKKMVVYEEGEFLSRRHLWVATDGLTPLLRNQEGKDVLRNVLADEDTCGRDNEGIDTTKQAFRRRFYRPFRSFFSDDIAVALLKRRMPGFGSAAEQKGTV